MLADNTPDTHSRPAAEAVLYEAALRLGVAFTDAISLMRFDAEADSAYWSVNRTTGAERIALGPRTLSHGPDVAECVLRHEVLHRSVLHGFRERYLAPKLANLALDVAINRLLVTAYPAAMRRACAVLYPAESRITPIALADPTADPARLPEKLVGLWRAIWGNDHQSDTVNPSSLYYQLLHLGEASIPSWYVAEGIASTAMLPSNQARLTERVLADLSKALPRGSGASRALRDFTVLPSDLVTGPLERWVAALPVRQVAGASALTISTLHRPSARVQPFPQWPTRVGLVWRAMGLSRVTRRYPNVDRVVLAARLSLGLYIDVSGSMQVHLSALLTILRALRDVPVQTYVFDDEVRAIDANAIDRGRLSGGGGTNFDAVLTHLAAQQDQFAGLVITDGDGVVSDAARVALKTTGKSLFVVTISEGPKPPRTSPDSLGQVASARYYVNASRRGLA